jgi:crotonobetainyl-CoA:carnitine CoA-transferase CaiB-like acyl-CoA transferase
MPLKLLGQLLQSLGAALPDAGQVEIIGADPVLATRFPIGEAAAVALAACGLAAAEIWRLRGGSPQRVRVDVTGAAASLLGFAYQRVEGGPATAAWREPRQVTGFYPARDGAWFMLHGSFPETQKKALELLGCAAEREAVAARIASWDAQTLEDAIAEHGLCGARVRTAAEWAVHEQGQTLARLPVVEVIKVGESPKEPFGTATRPLAGVRALDLTRVLAGPTCGRTLAAHGAEVLCISAPELPSVAPFVMDTSHGKRSAHLSLKRGDDAERLRALVRQADVFTQSYRSGALARLGFGPEALHALRPGLIYTSINCYGHEGPWASRPGWEQLAQTVTGIAYEQGGDKAPSLLPAAATDYNTGHLAALGTMIALARRAREGGSYHVRASLCQTGMWLQRMRRTEAVGPGLGVEQLRPFLTRSETPYGTLSHLGPIVELSETPAHWALPTVPLGTHEPVFASGA